MKKVIFFIVFCCSYMGKAQPTGSLRNIVVDAGSVRGTLNRNFNMCVGAGRANEGLRANWQRQLRYVKQQAGFSYNFRSKTTHRLSSPVKGTVSSIY